MNKKILIWFFYAILLFLLVAGVVFIFPLQKQWDESRVELERHRRIEAEKRAVAEQLNNDVNLLQNSPEAVEKVAREKFSLCREGETVMEYTVPPAK